MTNEMIVQEVEFNGNILRVAKSPENEKIYVGVNWVCDGVGFNKNGKDTQIKKMQSDIVLKEGCVKFDAGVFDPNNETVAIELDFLPLWLAKISITPSMQKNSPDVVENLIEYQLKAKDVLAKVFIEKVPYVLPESYKDALKHLLVKVEENEELKNENELMKPKAKFHDIVTESDDSISLINIAKSFGIGRNKFVTFLRCTGILFIQDDRYNIPKQQFQNQGYFKVSMKTFPAGSGYGVSYKTTVTGRGKTWLHKIVQKYGGSETINKLKMVEIEDHVKKMKKSS